MKTLTFSSKSWHYKLARFGNPYRNTSDICAYTRAILTGLMQLMIFLILSAVVLYCVADLLAWAAALATVWTLLEPQTGAWVILCFVSTLGLVILTGITVRMFEKSRSDDFVPAAVSSWWHKFCVPVKIINKE
jgi:hypothetical protein